MKKTGRRDSARNPAASPQMENAGVSVPVAERTMSRPTLKHVARDLGVSVTTVSMVLQNRDCIGWETRARVLAKIAELGYEPNAVARSLALRCTRTLGVVIPDLMHSFFVEILTGIEAVASPRGYGLLLCSSHENAAKERDEIQLLRQRQVEGIVLASANAFGNTDVLQQLASAGVALVMVDRDDHPNVACDRVVTDDEEVGRLATEHLIAQGRRAIAHVEGPPIAHAKRRAEGYRKALSAHGLAVRNEWIVPAGFMEADGYRATKRLFNRARKIDAVFAANDPAAIGSMKAIWESGRNVPDDVAVVGAGDIVFSDLLRVPLTTVAWSRVEQGRRAAELILRRIAGDVNRKTARVVIPPRLVVRSSSGAAPRPSSRVQLVPNRSPSRN